MGRPEMFQEWSSKIRQLLQVRESRKNPKARTSKATVGTTPAMGGDTGIDVIWPSSRVNLHAGPTRIGNTMHRGEEKSLEFVTGRREGTTESQGSGGGEGGMPQCT